MFYATVTQGFQARNGLVTKDNFHSTFEILEISCSQWNGTFRLHRPDSSHRTFGYYSCKQDAKEGYWGQQFCQMEMDISVRPNQHDQTSQSGPPSKVVPNILVGPNRNGLLHLISNQNFRNFGLNGKCPK